MNLDDTFSGRWVDENEDTDLYLTIDFTTGGPVVSAHCISDGEVLEVKNVKLDGRTLTFDTIVPSSSYWASHRMTFVSVDRCEVELTLRETWKRKWE